MNASEDYIEHLSPCGLRAAAWSARQFQLMGDGPSSDRVLKPTSVMCLGNLIGALKAHYAAL